MEPGELFTRWTVRLALALYVLSLALRILAHERRPWLAAARLVWTGGFCAFLVHVACAFQFYHHWSHHAAYDHTAQQTAEVVGLNWGGGVYINYVFALLWGTDVFWWLRHSQSYLNRSRCIEWTVQGFLAFIAFNGTVTFGVGTIRWAGLVASVLLVGLVAYTVFGNSSSKFE